MYDAGYGEGGRPKLDRGAGEDYEILDATALLDRRLGFERDTVLAYLS